MARRNRPMGPPPAGAQIRNGRAQRRRARNQAPRPALRARVGRPPGMPEVCRRYLARQAVGLFDETTDENGE